MCNVYEHLHKHKFVNEGKENECLEVKGGRSFSWNKTNIGGSSWKIES